MALRRRLVFCATWGVRPRARTCATKARVSEPRSAPRVAPAGTRSTMANAASHSAVPVAGGEPARPTRPLRVVHPARAQVTSFAFLLVALLGRPASRALGEGFGSVLPRVP